MKIAEEKRNFMSEKKTFPLKNKKRSILTIWHLNYPETY